VAHGRPQCAVAAHAQSRNGTPLARRQGRVGRIDPVGPVRRLPVVYLLHGYSGDELAWQRITDLRPLAEQFGVIFVCPDGENSWYWDSPINPSSQFETFVSQELPDWVDAHYPTALMTVWASQRA